MRTAEKRTESEAHYYVLEVSIQRCAQTGCKHQRCPIPRELSAPWGWPLPASAAGSVPERAAP